MSRKLGKMGLWLFFFPHIRQFKSLLKHMEKVRKYQSVKPAFNPDVKYMRDRIYRDIPSVDNSLFIISKKLLIDERQFNITLNT